MSRLPIAAVVGARPNFMKVAPLARILDRDPRIRFFLIHTGQHYGNMSDPFLRELGMPPPARHLRVGSDSAARQIGKIMVCLAPVLDELRPRLVVVAGDVNSTLAAALAAHKAGIPVAHIEAGLRSFDESMPEETNRRLTDQISEICLTPSADADRNLRREGIPRGRIRRVGNLMIDTLRRLLPAARRSRILERLDLRPRSYAVLTLHRPSNVDREEDLRKFAGLLGEIARRIPVVFPVHPRTRASARRFRIWPPTPPGLHLIDPLGDLDFLRLEDAARFVMTDSGGIQEETTVLGVPCLTLRRNTERPVTIRMGTNRLAGVEPEGILGHVERILRGDIPRRRIPPLWDGKAAVRAAREIVRFLGLGVR